MAGSMDEDTRRAIASGRQTLGEMLSTAQTHLQKAFVAFTLGLVGTIYVLRRWVWDLLKADLNASPYINVIAVTPFDVILLQAKIGIAVGLLLALPVVLYYSRDALRRRGWWPDERVSRLRLSILVGLVVLLFLLGISYAYFVFFPVMLGFLASNAHAAGFQPNWSIVMWANFIFLLAMSFGLAAQLPLAMSTLTYAGIVSYPAFRDKWRHAILVIFGFGAVFSPPDPFTQIMWAVPLIGLYAVSLGLSKLVWQAKRSSGAVDVRAVARQNWNYLAGTALLAFGAVYGAVGAGAVAALNDLLAAVGSSTRLATPAAALGLPPGVATSIVAAVVAAVATGIVLFYLVSRALRAAVLATDPTALADPSNLRLEELPTESIGDAPAAAFEDRSEAEVLEHARSAMEADDPERAQALLDRYDEVRAGQEGEGEDDAGADGAQGAAAEAADGAQEENFLTRTTTGVVDAFSEEETTEEEIGGYYTDIAFVFESLTSKSFRIAGTFGIVMTLTFAFLYYGGIRRIKEAFLERMPPSTMADVGIVTLHPAEALVFMVKFSVVVGAIATLPMILYYAWPTLRERGLIRGDRRVVMVWGGSLLVGLVGSSLVGFLYIAPTVISWLAWDAVQAHMVISYRINAFGWLVIATTVGIGILGLIPVSMLLFHAGGIVPYRTMRERWRGVVFATFVVAMFATPADLLTMFIVVVPVSTAYVLGLGVLWIVTLGGRRSAPSAGEPAD